MHPDSNGGEAEEEEDADNGGGDMERMASLLEEDSLFRMLGFVVNIKHNESDCIKKSDSTDRYKCDDSPCEGVTDSKFGLISVDQDSHPDSENREYQV